MRRRGADEGGRESVAALAAIESVLKAERLFEPALLEPLAAFTNLLQSSQLPPEFGDFSLADALLAIEDAHAELRQNAEQIWEFAPEVSPEAVANLADFLTPPSAPLAGAPEHTRKLQRCVLDAARTVEPGRALVVGALSCPDLPLAELATRFDRLTLSDLDLPALEALVRRAIPEGQRGRIELERYDLTGSYVAFAQGVKNIVEQAAGPAEAESKLVELVQSYDVGAGSAGLSRAEEKPNLAISVMVLSELGRGYARCIASALAARGWDPAAPSRAPLAESLAFLRCLVAQHHVHALLRRAKAAVLISAVSEVPWQGGPGNQGGPAAEPTDVLAVERLVERLPQSAEIKAEQSWEWRQGPAAGGASAGLLTLVEALLI
jgi:hypothetical protein